MRINFKYLAVIGLVIAAAVTDTWRKHSHRTDATDDDTAAVDYALKVRARVPTQCHNSCHCRDQLDCAIGCRADHRRFDHQPGHHLARHVSQSAGGRSVGGGATRQPAVARRIFQRLGLQMTNTAVPPAVRRAIFADLLMRPNALKLPWLVEVARASLDGQSDEALLLLKSQLREIMARMGRWRERIAVWLSLHPG